MAAQGYRAPVNYRSAPSRVGTPEAIAISSGVALLSEAPADPTNPATPVIVTVNGTSRTRVTGAPGVGQYRIRSQTLIGVNGLARTEYLPVLEFNAADEGRTGTVDYYQIGTVLTAEWADALLALLTPLTNIAAAGDLPLYYPATSNVYAPGRPGRIAFLSDGSMYFSDGTQWRVVAANVSPNNWSEALATALRFGIGSTSAFSAAWTTTESLAQAFGISSSQTYATGMTGAGSIAQALGLAFASAFTASWTTAQSFGPRMGFSAAESYTAGGGGGGPISAPRYGAQVNNGGSGASLSVPYPAEVASGTTLLLVGTNIDTGALISDGWTEYVDATRSYLVLVKRSTGALSGTLNVPGVYDGEVSYYPADARMFAWDNVASSPFVAADAAPTSSSGATVTGTSGFSVAAGDVMILVDFSGGRKAAIGAGGSINSFIAGDTGGVSATLNLGYQSNPVASGAQAAPTLTVSSATSHYRWTAALKKA